MSINQKQKKERIISLWGGQKTTHHISGEATNVASTIYSKIIKKQDFLHKNPYHNDRHTRRARKESYSLTKS